MTVEPPDVPGERLAAGGWQETERSRDRPFDAGFVSVEAHTLVYDDAVLRERLHEATGVDHPWRFFLAARLRLRPATSPSGPLTRLVTDRARSGFRDRLADRGFRNLRVTGTTTRDAGGVTRREATYGAVTPTDHTTLRTRASLSVWPDDDSYLLAGGGYPIGVRDANDDVRAVLSEAIDADAFERELAELVDAVE